MFTIYLLSKSKVNKDCDPKVFLTDQYTVFLNNSFFKINSNKSSRFVDMPIALMEYFRGMRQMRQLSLA